jgi:asparagine synthase (glutamine-hydrolysing)
MKLLALFQFSNRSRHSDKRIHIVVNGEFYDFERQRRELEQRGHLFRTRSDSEIALHLYEELGAHCVQHLRGEFAFVLWDEANRRIFAARDRFGIKPLYYAVHDDTLYLASEIKALFAAGVPAHWDQEYFYQHATGPAMSDRTLFDGVHQVLMSVLSACVIRERFGLGSKAADSAAFEKKGSYS